MRASNTADAINSADVEALGDLLFNHLGQTTIQNYVANYEVRSDFDAAFRAVRAFLGPSHSKTIEPKTAPVSARLSGSGHPNLAQVDLEREESVDVDTWSEFARSRRSLEIALRSELADANVEVRKVSSPLHLLRLGMSAGLFQDLDTAALESSILVANRAIHGDEVTSEAVEYALSRINLFLDYHSSATDT